MRKTAFTAAALAVVALTGCEGLLEVEDPQRFTDADLNQAPDAVANGAVGNLHQELDDYVIATALASDEYMHTGTWDGYDDYDHGRFRYGDANQSDPLMADLLRTRWFAGAAQARFDSILDSPSSDPRMAKVKTVEAFANLYLGESWCEAPAEQGGSAVPRAQILQQAASQFQEAESAAQSAGLTEYATAAVAGRARANLLLGNYDQAASDAAQVSTGFTFEAVLSAATGNQENSIVQLTTRGNNTAAGLRQKWWDDVDADADRLVDPWTGELDSRVPVRYEDGVLGVDGRTPHFSQGKYQGLGANIPIVHGHEMRLIEAEAAWRNGDYQGAVDIINDLRSSVGLSPVSNPGTEAGVRERLLHARFAETFLEGRRLADLHRFDLVQEMVDAGQFGDETFDPRPTLFPLTQDEGINNPNIEDNVNARCLPMSSGG
jgi:hypothetical protein